MRKWFTAFLLVLLTAFPALALPSTQEAEKLAYGQNISGILSADTRERTYTFSGSAGDTIYISMYAPMPTLVRLTGANGTLLAESEGNSVIGSLIGPYTLRGDGIYTITATQPQWAEASGGEFGLVVDRAASIDPLQLNAESGAALPGPGTAHFFSFEGTADDLISYWLAGSQMALQIISPNGENIAYNGIEDFLQGGLVKLRENGTYTLIVQTLAPEAVDFQMGITTVEPAVLAPGTPISADLSESAPAVFQFESAQGKMWQLSATVADASYATSLEIYSGSDPSYSIAGDGASGPGGFPRVEPFIAPEDGVYYVVLSFDDYTTEDATRAYTITLAPSTLLSLVPGTAIEGTVSPDQGTAIYAYTGAADEHIRVTVSRQGSAGFIGLGMRTTEEQFLYVTNYGNLRSFSFEYVLPRDGIYLFEISNQDYEPSEIPFSILIEKVE